MRSTSRGYLERSIRGKVGRAIHDYRMIGRGDRVMVAVSGGKDSIVLLKVLSLLRSASPVSYELVPVHIRGGYETGVEDVLAWCTQETGYEVMVVDFPIKEILETKGDPDKSPCALCSRLRRGALYGLASRLGVASIALGHHMDDIIETFLLRCFYTGQIGAMAPARVTDDGKNRIIRPLAYCTEELVDAYFAHLGVQPARMACPVRADGKRKLIKDYIKLLERDIPRIRYSLFASLGNIDMRSLCMKGGIHADTD